MYWVQEMVGQEGRYTLDNFAQGHAALGFEPVYMLNMITKDLDDQLGQLRRARDLGMPVRYVELGNEYFFGPGAEPLVHDRYPTPIDYIRDANRWAAAIKAKFPEALVAVIGSESESPSVSERRRTWNAQIAPHVGSDIDAVTYHPYAGVALVDAPRESHWGNEAVQRRQRELLADPKAVQFMIGVPADDFTHLRAKHASDFDRPLALWLTEFNCNDWHGGVRHTWAQGLALISQYHAFLEEPGVQLLNLHNLTGGVLFTAMHPEAGDTFRGVTAASPPSVKPQSPTAIGLVTAVFGRAANGMKRAAAIDFRPEAAFETPRGAMVELVGGWVFFRADGIDGRNAVMFNLSPAAVSADLAALNLAASGYERWSTDPSRYVGDASTLRTLGKVGDTFDLPPYSLVLITAGAD